MTSSMMKRMIFLANSGSTFASSASSCSRAICSASLFRVGRWKVLFSLELADSLRAGEALTEGVDKHRVEPVDRLPVFLQNPVGIVTAAHDWRHFPVTGRTVAKGPFTS